jgi:SSS family solute:Na+ symporter
MAYSDRRSSIYRIPIAYNAVGGYDAIKTTLDPKYLSLTNVHWYQILNWSVTIIPIWFVGMTLYQRIYASKGEKKQKAWLIAGVFEWPIMAFLWSRNASKSSSYSRNV